MNISPLKQSYEYNLDGTINYNLSNMVPEDPPIFHVFEFEKFDYQSSFHTIHTHWEYPLYIGAIYIATIFGIQHFMKNRKPFELKRELFLWNAALGIFSICGWIRLAPEFLYYLTGPTGLHTSLCVSTGSLSTIFWGAAFLWSKWVELGDTVFIVLRKKPLLFLQWYHHILTLAVTWWSLPYLEAVGRSYGVMNYGVHSLMYPYFALRALDVKVPKKVANLITTLQFAQMIGGLFINSYSTYLYYSGTPCLRSPFTMKMIFVVYGSFVFIFGELFYRLVIQRTKKTE